MSRKNLKLEKHLTIDTSSHNTQSYRKAVNTLGRLQVACTQKRWYTRRLVHGPLTIGRRQVVVTQKRWCHGAWYIIREAQMQCN